MTPFALLARVEAKPGKEQAVEDFLKSALALGPTRTRNSKLVRVKIKPFYFWYFRYV